MSSVQTDEARATEMRRLYDEDGLSLREIGDKYAVSAERVRQILKKTGYTARIRPEFQPRLRTVTVRVTRVQVKEIEIEDYSEPLARERALKQIVFDDGLPMRTRIRATVVRKDS